MAGSRSRRATAGSTFWSISIPSIPSRQEEHIDFFLRKPLKTKGLIQAARGDIVSACLELEPVGSASTPKLGGVLEQRSGYAFAPILGRYEQILHAQYRQAF